MTSKSIGQFKSNTTGSKGNLGDYQHAARLFVDTDLRLAPKTKFNFHVVFSINTNALKDVGYAFKHRYEVGMLVKSIELPKFVVTVDTLNQYNRKKVVQQKIEYSPVSIRFHDDNLGVTRQLWENYFSYYYADPTAAKQSGSYNRIAMANGNFIRTPYGFDNGSTTPFFDKITIYQMAKKKWNSYTLINPVITSWNHDSLDYSNGTAAAEQSMTVAYESVTYNNGEVSQGNPPGFGGPEHYDTVPGPIEKAGGSTRGLFGQSSILSNVTQIIDDVASGKSFESPVNLITTAINAVNTYQNVKELTLPGAARELNTILNNSSAELGVSGIKEAVFPVSQVVNGVANTVAILRNLTS